MISVKIAHSIWTITISLLLISCTPIQADEGVGPDGIRVVSNFISDLQSSRPKLDTVCFPLLYNSDVIKFQPPHLIIPEKFATYDIRIHKMEIYSESDSLSDVIGDPKRYKSFVEFMKDKKWIGILITFSNHSKDSDKIERDLRWLVGLERQVDQWKVVAWLRLPMRRPPERRKND